MLQKMRIAARQNACKWAVRYMERRPPDHVIGEGYMQRWYVTPWRRWIYLDRSYGRLAALKGTIGRKLPHVYLHYYTGSDDARALHDHPWPSLSWMLRGSMLEHFTTDNWRQGPQVPGRDYYFVMAGDWRYRRAELAHCLELVSADAITLFITGRKKRTWGFFCPQGWRHYRQYIDRGGCE